VVRISPVCQLARAADRTATLTEPAFRPAFTNTPMQQIATYTECATTDARTAGPSD
jgi:hypothetical protein